MRSHLYRPHAQQNAQSLRRNMTPQERHGWVVFLAGGTLSCLRAASHQGLVVGCDSPAGGRLSPPS